MGYEVEDLMEITNMEGKILAYMQMYHNDKIDTFNALCAEEQAKFPDWNVISIYKLVLSKLGFKPPALFKQLEEVEEKMTQKQETPAAAPAGDVNRVKLPGDLSFEDKVLAKLEGLSFTISSMNDWLKEIAENTSIDKEIKLRLTALLEHLLARLDSIGNQMGGPMVDSLSIPPPAPAFAIPTQSSQVTTQTTVTPGVGAPQVAPTPQLNVPVPAQPVAITPGAQNGNKPPAPRQQLDASQERGQAPPDKKYSFVQIIATPLEFTAKAVKCTFQYADSSGIQKKGWDARYNTDQVWIAKSMISPDTIIQRIQTPQYFLVPNWWADKNSIAAI